MAEDVDSEQQEAQSDTSSGTGAGTGNVQQTATSSGSADGASGDQSQSAGPVGSGTYEVQQGDCMDSIAFKHGFFWETIWNHLQNAGLKQVRQDPFILLEGDRVFIPELREKQESGSTERRHRFRRKGVPGKLRIHVRRLGKPRAEEPYRLEIDGIVTQGTTGMDGLVEASIPPNASRGELTVGAKKQDQQVFDLVLGGMDPISEVVGVQKRLDNMGFACSSTGVLDEQTRNAIGLFQTGFDLPVTAELDQQTRDRIKKEYGS